MGFDVVVAGGSFAGLAFARGLSQAVNGQVRISILERTSSAMASGQSRDRRAFAIWAGARQALEGLGVWDSIEASAEPMTQIEISDSALGDGVRPTRLTYDAHLRDGAPVAHMVPADVLLTALIDGVAEDPAITWLAPVEAAGFARDDAAATVTLADGRGLRCELCVAADGRNSRLRDAAGIKTIGWPYGQNGIVATVAFSEPHNGIAIQHFLPGGPFAILPLRDNQACITWSASRAEAERMMALDDEAFLCELDRRIAGRFGVVSLAGPRQAWPLDVKLPRALVGPRLALIGDAAHGVHPIAGQGVNLALRDAAALIECVADSVRIGFDCGHRPALERYQRWRRFDATMSASLYDGLNRLFSADNMLLRAGRGTGLNILDRLPKAKQMILDEAAGVTGDLPKLVRGEAV